MGLDSVELVMNAERMFNIELPDATVEHIYTFGEFVDCVFSACEERNYKVSRREIHDTLRRMVSEHLDVPEHEIKAESNFIKDLGLN